MDWPKARSFVAPEDLYTPHTWPLEASFAVFNAYEKVAPQWLRSKALDWVYELLRKEDEFTKCVRSLVLRALLAFPWLSTGASDTLTLDR